MMFYFLFFVFVLIYILIVVNPFKIKEVYYALCGMAMILVSAIFEPENLFFRSFKLLTVLEPWKILIFFLSIALFSFVLNQLNFLKYIAVITIRFAKHDGKRLFKYVFILSAITSYFLSNDVVILTLTPLILHFTQLSKINPVPYLLSMFFVANTSSIGLISSNTTNFIVSTSINSFEYFLIAAIPITITLFFQYYLLRLVFHNDIDVVFDEELLDAKKIIKEKTKTKLVVIIEILTLLSFIFSSYIGVEIWLLALIGSTLALIISRVKFSLVIKNLPYNPLLIAIFFFINLSVLLPYDFAKYVVKLIAEYVAEITIFNFIGITMFFSFVNSIFINIPTTAFLNHSLQASPDVFLNIILIISSNLGANLFIMGSLAGILWFHFVREHNINIHLLDFVKYGVLITIPTIVLISSLFFGILVLG